MLLQHGGNTRFVWNLFLTQNIEYYKNTKKFKFYYELSASLPELRRQFDFLNTSFSQSLQVVAKQFDRALRDSFKRKKGFPSFKSKSLLTDSFTCPQAWYLKKHSVYIPKIGEVKWIKSRALQGKPKSITISQDGKHWYCSVLCEVEIAEKQKKSDNIVGIDVGLKQFATLSDGTVVGNPRHIKNYEYKLTKQQRKLSKKQIGSSNRLKQRMKVRKVYNKIKNVRQDFLHKVTSNMITKYDGVVLEDLNVKSMMKNHQLAKSIADASWPEFRRQLEYKSKWNFNHFILIDRFEPTSKTCSICGNIQDMPLHKRQFDCDSCRISMDRDFNAAMNIKNLGLTTLGHSGVACGVEALVSTVKQEKECLINQAEATKEQSCRMSNETNPINAGVPDGS